MRSSVKPSESVNDNLIDRTIETWQPRLERDLSREDARQIVESVIGFFSILSEWSKADQTEPTIGRGNCGEIIGDEARDDR